MLPSLCIDHYSSNLYWISVPCQTLIILFIKSYNIKKYETLFHFWKEGTQVWRYYEYCAKSKAGKYQSQDSVPGHFLAGVQFATSAIPNALCSQQEGLHTVSIKHLSKTINSSAHIIFQIDYFLLTFISFLPISPQSNLIAKLLPKLC